MDELMNTKEVATYLGIHEKKVYYLVKTGKIPCTRVTGKWVFPKNLIEEWIEKNARGALKKERPEERSFLLVAGSDDPSLGILRELYTNRMTPTSLFFAPVGSRTGLDALRDGVADLALAHLHDPATGEYNLPFLRKALPSGATAVPLFYRELGLLLTPGNPLGIQAIGDLPRPGIRMINRQKGSGTRIYLDQELARSGIHTKQIKGYESHVVTHVEVGLEILRGKADTGVATRATARLLGLDFIPLTWERFDMLIDKERFFFRGIQVLLNIVASQAFRSRMQELEGYDTSESGRLLIDPEPN
ncbi:MAG: substrate-binding domain-containing protein [Candidatus Binatia bacterium]